MRINYIDDNCNELMMIRLGSDMLDLDQRISFAISYFLSLQVPVSEVVNERMAKLPFDVLNSGDLGLVGLPLMLTCFILHGI